MGFFKTLRFVCTFSITDPFRIGGYNEATSSSTNGLKSSTVTAISSSSS